MATELETARLVGRPPHGADVAAMLAIYADAGVAAHLYPDGRHRRSRALGFACEREVEHLGSPHRRYRRRRPAAG